MAAVSTPFWFTDSNKGLLTEARVTIHDPAIGGERSDMGARTMEEKQGPLEKHRRAIRRTDEQRTSKTTKAGTVALFIVGSPERQKISNMGP
ncbi:hypothetical protein CRG98_042104 [Punica granatum]|uniref:Uncharacterized protein n=1 Tax=Punica granatum TaxID=22663 RepID=A0A2I0I207_PUNGR|nr:hypothetical protein CRG98_042104 [Punica granatum]